MDKCFLWKLLNTRWSSLRRIYWVDEFDTAWEIDLIRRRFFPTSECSDVNSNQKYILQVPIYWKRSQLTEKKGITSPKIWQFWRFSLYFGDKQFKTWESHHNKNTRLNFRTVFVAAAIVVLSTWWKSDEVAIFNLTKATKR